MFHIPVNYLVAKVTPQIKSWKSINLLHPPRTSGSSWRDECHAF